MEKTFIYDKICGAGKTSKTLEFINQHSHPRDPSLNTTKFIIVTPFTMECHRIAGTIPVDIPIEYKNMFPLYEIMKLDEGFTYKSRHAEDTNLEPRVDSNGNLIYGGHRGVEVRDIKFPLRKYSSENGRKSRLNGIKEELRANNDIVITHSAFLRFDKEVIEIIREQGNYTLIIDEVPEVFGSINSLLAEINGAPANISRRDIGRLNSLGFLSVEEESDLVSFHSVMTVENLDFASDLKYYCDEDRVIWYADAEEGDEPILYLRLHPDIFRVVNQTLILTYQFEGSICKAYFDLYDIGYRYIELPEELLLPHYRKDPIKYWELINISNGNSQFLRSLNKYSLSMKWYERSRNIGKLYSEISNFFNGRCRNFTEGIQDRLWTSFKGPDNRFVKRIVENTRGITEEEFISITARATNNYSHKVALAYLVNRFPNTGVKNYFSRKGIALNEEAFATGELIQWIFRSRLRNGEPIMLYLPSPRMKALLLNWMEEYKAEYNTSINSE